MGKQIQSKPLLRRHSLYEGLPVVAIVPPDLFRTVTIRPDRKDTMVFSFRPSQPFLIDAITPVVSHKGRVGIFFQANPRHDAGHGGLAFALPTTGVIIGSRIGHGTLVARGDPVGLGDDEFQGGARLVVPGGQVEHGAFHIVTYSSRQLLFGEEEFQGLLGVQRMCVPVFLLDHIRITGLDGIGPFGKLADIVHHAGYGKSL